MRHTAKVLCYVLADIYYGRLFEVYQEKIKIPHKLLYINVKLRLSCLKNISYLPATLVQLQFAIAQRLLTALAKRF